ncbi:hypothetical protein [Nonomuraea helvata]|uniref:Uncharacterized protein n=1 Tax=Nonomuraea helvata TaxID=37484 RepID=A0ABV5SIX9_9ACTN
MDEERLKCLDLTDGGFLAIPDEYDATLGTFLHFGIDTDPYKCLVVLYHTAQIWQRRSRREVIVGDEVTVALTPEHAAMEDHFDPLRSRSIPFAEFRSAVEELWVVLYRAYCDDRRWPIRSYRPGLAPAQGDVVLWEETFGQRHPYRGMIEGIPARGLD